METRRMEMDIVLKRVDGAASEAEREAGLREAKEIADRATGEVEVRAASAPAAFSLEDGFSQDRLKAGLRTEEP